VPAETVEAEVGLKEPAIKPEAKADDKRVRDESGRFAPKGEPAKEEAAKPEAAAPKVDSKEAAPDPAAQALRPPTSWSPTAKVAFEKLPPEVQQAVSKR